MSAPRLAVSVLSSVACCARKPTIFGVRLTVIRLRRSAASRRQCNFVSQLAGRVGGPCDNPNGHGGRTDHQPDADARGARNVESFRLPPTAPRRNGPSEKCSRLSTAVPMHSSKVTVFWFATPRRYGTSGRGVLSKQFQDKGIGGSALGSLQCFGDFS
jgi:hypothetical protein